VWDAVKQGLGGLVVLLILFGVLKPAIKNLSKSIAPVMHIPAPAGGAPSDEEQLSLANEAEVKKLAGPKSPHDKNMQIAQDTVEQDPKLVAQVVKSWVTENG
jgi:flagellar M-ring protein FliF